MLYWKYPSRVLLRCLDKNESIQVRHQFHTSNDGDHHYWKTTTQKIFRVGSYWPFLFVDVCAFVKACDKCQRFTGKQQLKSLPLRPIVVNEPFQQRVLDFIGEIHPSSSGQQKSILAEMNYFTKLIAAIPTRNDTRIVIINFLYAHIFIQLVHSTSYYPQGNGLDESSNKS